MSSLKGKKIVIADDEVDLRKILTEVLQAEGAIVFEAENGNKAFTIIESQKIDIVISDIRMPGGDGVELLEKIKQSTGAGSGTRPALFIMTGYSDVTEEKAKSLGITSIFNKPFDLEKFIEAIQKSKSD